jgi:2'-5' RNA ligase
MEAEPGCPGAAKDSDRHLGKHSLVSYVPGELGEAITALRRQLVKGCNARSHVTVLPPRRIRADEAEAVEFLRRKLEGCPPFEIEFLDVATFENNPTVIYAQIGQGLQELLQLHERLHCGPVDGVQEFRYHPHLTLAQGLDPSEIETRLEQIRPIWRELAYGRRYLVTNLTFVRNIGGECWIDVADFPLAPVASPSVERPGVAVRL